MRPQARRSRLRLRRLWKRTTVAGEESGQRCERGVDSVDRSQRCCFDGVVCKNIASKVSFGFVARAKPSSEKDGGGLGKHFYGGPLDRPCSIERIDVRDSGEDGEADSHPLVERVRARIGRCRKGSNTKGSKLAFCGATLPSQREAARSLTDYRNIYRSALSKNGTQRVESRGNQLVPNPEAALLAGHESSIHEDFHVVTDGGLRST